MYLASLAREYQRSTLALGAIASVTLFHRALRLELGESRAPQESFNQFLCASCLVDRGRSTLGCLLWERRWQKGVCADPDRSV